MSTTRVDGDFLALLNQYRGAIERVSRMYTSSATEREELAQEKVYQLWRAFPSYRSESAPLTWVYRIAINTAITGLRRQARRPPHVPLDAADTVASPPASPARDPRTELLYRVIRRLGRVDRALIMCYLDDLSYREIADVLGLSETNVGARLSTCPSTSASSCCRQPSSSAWSGGGVAWARGSRHSWQWPRLP